MKRAILIFVLVAPSVHCQPAHAGWSDIAPSIRAKVQGFGSTPGATPISAQTTPKAAFCVWDDDPRSAYKGQEVCKGTKEYDEWASLDCGSQIQEEQRQAVAAVDKIINNTPPLVDASCFDKYKNMKLGMHVGVPDFSNILQRLMNQACRAADTKVNTATAPYNKTVWGPDGSTVNTSVFSGNGGQGGVTAGTTGAYQVPNVFK